jgi:hypothetical protein
MAKNNQLPLKPIKQGNVECVIAELIQQESSIELCADDVVLVPRRIASKYLESLSVPKL